MKKCNKCYAELTDSNWMPSSRAKREYTCNVCVKIRAAIWYKKNRESVKSRQVAKVLYYKQTVFEHYGNRCACCGETYFWYLQLDHKENNGAAHRRELYKTRTKGSNKNWWLWIIRNNFPEYLQLLCANCHFAKTRNKSCNHTYRNGILVWKTVCREADGEWSSIQPAEFSRGIKDTTVRDKAEVTEPR